MSDNQPFVFARVGGVAHYITRTNTGWTDWTSLGGPSTDGFRDSSGTLAAIRNADGRIELFSVFRSLSHVRQLTDTEWSEWDSFGDGGYGYHQVAVAQNSARALELFTMGAGLLDTFHFVYHWVYTATGWQYQGGFSLLDGLQYDANQNSTFAVGRNKDGHLEVFAIGTSGVVYHSWQDASSESGWTDWNWMGGWSDQLAVTQNATGNLELFARGSGQALYHRYQDFSITGGWSDWEILGNTIETFVVASNANGTLEVFVIDTNNSLSHIWQDPSANGGWSAWASLGGWSDMLAVDRNPDGRLEVFARGSDKALYHIWQDPSAWNGWSGWVRLAGPIDDYALACPVMVQPKSAR